MNIDRAYYQPPTMTGYRSKGGGNFNFGQTAEAAKSGIIREQSRSALSLAELDAQSAAARARVQNPPPVVSASEESEAAQVEGSYHWQTFADKEIPSSEAPDYSTWDKEDAYCDIVKRYNLLNLLSPEKVKELGLSEESKQMQIEYNNLLYGWHPFDKDIEVLGRDINLEEFKNLSADDAAKLIKASNPSKEVLALETDLPQRMNRKVYCEMYGITSDEEYEESIKREVANMYDTEDFGAWGVDSAGAQVYQKLSQFDLTDNKANLMSTLPGSFVFTPLDFSPFYRQNPLDVDFNEYYDYLDEQLRQEIALGTRQPEAYEAFRKWSDLLRDVYDLIRAA